MKARIEPSKLLLSLQGMNCTLNNAGFNELAKFDLLWKDLTDIRDLLQVVIYPGSADYNVLKGFVFEYDKNR